MKLYKIKKQTNPVEGYEVMVVLDRETGEQQAVYRLTPGAERQEIASMRRELDNHFANPGSTFGNYPF